MKIITILAFILFVGLAPANADHTPEDHHEHIATNQTSEPLTDVELKPNEIIVQVSGVVCSFCAYGLQKKLSKLPFVDQSKFKNGILVNIENQRVTIAIKSGEKVDIDILKQTIKSGGYEPMRVYLGSDKDEIISNELGKDRE